MVSKPTRPLDYAILKFTSSTPALDYAIIKLLCQHTRQWRHIGCAFPPEHSGIKIVTLRRNMAELWNCFVDFVIPIFMNFDKLKTNYELILSKISKNGLQTHLPPWLRNITIHIIDTSPWLRDNKIVEHTHTRRWRHRMRLFPLNTQV